MCLQTQLSTLCSVIPEMYLSTSPKHHHIYIQVYLSIYNIVSYIYTHYIFEAILTISIPFHYFDSSHVPHDFWSEFARKGAFRVTGALQVAEHWAKVRCNKKIPRKPMASLEEHCSYSIVIIMIYKWLGNICWSSKWLTKIVIHILFSHLCLMVCKPPNFVQWSGIWLPGLWWQNPP